MPSPRHSFKKISQYCRSLKKHFSGFTMVELLIVVTILGILISLSLPVFDSLLANTRDYARRSDLNRLKIALKVYNTYNNKYPTTTAEGISIEEDADFNQALNSKYIQKMPKDPLYPQLDPLGKKYSFYYLATSTSRYTACVKAESKTGYFCVDQNTNSGIAQVPSAQWLDGGGSCGTVNYGGHDYPTIKIGSQCWLAENLNVGTRMDSNYFNGSDYVVNSQGTDCSSPAAINKFCFFNVDANCDANGALYQWNQAMCGSASEGVQGICPTGWHLPSDNDLFLLEDYLKDLGQACDPNRDMSSSDKCSTAGAKLQSSGSSGFNAALAGSCDMMGMCGNQGNSVTYWSSSLDISNGRGRTRLIEKDYDWVVRSSRDTAGSSVSVRCVKN